jgi:PAS domain S-box-containing protein
LDDDRNLEGRAQSLRGRSDVDLVTELSLLTDAARARTGELRERASSEATRDGAWIHEALQELDTAHEELRVAEEELHSQADELTASHTELAFERSRYRELFDAAPEPYLTTDAHGVILEANRRAVQLLGVPMIFILGKPLAIFVDPELRTGFRHDVSAAVLDETGLVSSFELALSVPRTGTGRHHAPASRRVRASVSRGVGASRKSWELRWILHERMPERSGRSSEPHTIEPPQDAATVRALVESKLRDDLAREQRARLESELARRHSEELLALISQELRGSLRMAKDSLAPFEAAGAGPVDSQARQGSAQSEMRAMTLTLERLLREISAGGASLAPVRREIDLLELIHGVIERSEGIASFAGARIVAKLNRPLPVVQGDPMRIAQILQTVLENALRRAPTEGIVEITASADTRRVEISVRGATQDVTDTTGPLRKQERASAWLGVGLSLARHLTELHGGTLETECEGTQAVLHVRLPHESGVAPP